MNKDNVPMKYVLGMWRVLPGYPTRMDVVWEVLTVASKARSAEFTRDDLDRAMAVVPKSASHLDALFADGSIRKTRTSGGKDYYKLDESSNPFV